MQKKNILKKCTSCAKYKTCSTLCKAVENFVNQDEVLADYVTLGYGINNVDDTEPIELSTSVSNKKLVYQLHFLDKMKTDEIAYHVSINKRQIRNIIQKLKANVKNPELARTGLQRRILSRHFVQGNSLEYISEIHQAHLGNIYDIVANYVSSIKVT